MLKNFSKLRLDIISKKSNLLFSFNNTTKFSFTLQLTREQKEESNFKTYHK